MPKSKYETHIEPNLELITQWAREGLSLEQIAGNLGISKSTLCLHQNNHSDLSDALREGRDVADAHVANKLYLSAIGFYFKEQVMTPSGKIEEIERYSKPNVQAAQFWLKNRVPGKWTDKKELEHSGSLGVQIVDDIDDATD